LLFGSCDEDDGRAPFGKGFRDRSTDPAPRAGDHANLFRERHALAQCVRMMLN
jgi:hypothetical protein